MAIRSGLLLIGCIEWSAASIHSYASGDGKGLCLVHIQQTGFHPRIKSQVRRGAGPTIIVLLPTCAGEWLVEVKIGRSNGSGSKSVPVII